MSLQKSLQVETRSSQGKCPNRRLRAQDIVPGIYYDAKGVNIPVQVPALPLNKAFQTLGSTQVFDLIINDGGQTRTMPSIIWKMHRHPFKNQVMHVDFYGVDLNKEIKLVVPVQLIGECQAVKTEGGVLSVFREHIEVLCLPLSIPDHIVIDVSNLQLGHNITLEDLTFPEGVKPIYDENYAVVGVSIPSEEEKAPGEEAEAAPEA